MFRFDKYVEYRIGVVKQHIAGAQVERLCGKASRSGIPMIPCLLCARSAITRKGRFEDESLYTEVRQERDLNARTPVPTCVTHTRFFTLAALDQGDRR